MRSFVCGGQSVVYRMERFDISRTRGLTVAHQLAKA